MVKPVKPALIEKVITNAVYQTANCQDSGKTWIWLLTRRSFPVNIYHPAQILPNKAVQLITTMDEVITDQNRFGSCSRVKLNVGGRHFEISRSLANQYPGSMLHRLVSETWHKSNHDRTIFIDRDGDMFRYIVNYMRYGSIELPPSVPKTMFHRELDYYQLANTGIIKQESSVELMKELKNYVEKAELHHDMLLIAVNCYQQYMMGKKEVKIVDNLELKHNPYHYHFGDAMRILNYYLGKFHGLQAFASQTSLYSPDFLLEVKELKERNVCDDEHFPTLNEIEHTLPRIPLRRDSIDAADMMPH